MRYIEKMQDSDTVNFTVFWDRYNLVPESCADPQWIQV